MQYVPAPDVFWVPFDVPPANKSSVVRFRLNTLSKHRVRYHDFYGFHVSDFKSRILGIQAMGMFTKLEQNKTVMHASGSAIFLDQQSNS